MGGRKVRRRDVLMFRLRQEQLDRLPNSAAGPTDVALLDYGVQDTGFDGAPWALAIRGAPAVDADDVAYAWTLRGAPHAYRRVELSEVAAATAPRSDADAAKRIFDASKPLKAAGIPALEALRVVAGHLREIVDEPTPKGDASSALTRRLDDPYLRFCRPCNTTHVYEMPFRLAALQAGLELQANTSPPVLSRIPGLSPLLFGAPGGEPDGRFDLVRNHLRFYGPTRPRDVATFVDSPVKDVRAHWPDDVVEVTVTDLHDGSSEPRFVLAGDWEALSAERSDPEPAVRLLGSHDPYLQLRDRELLVTDGARRQQLWPVLGRPGAVVANGEVVGTWRPRTSAGKLTLRLEPWGPLPARHSAAVAEQAERLAAHRQLTLAGVVVE